MGMGLECWSLEVEESRGRGVEGSVESSGVIFVIDYFLLTNMLSDEKDSWLA